MVSGRHWINCKAGKINEESFCHCNHHCTKTSYKNVLQKECWLFYTCGEELSYRTHGPGRLSEPPSRAGRGAGGEGGGVFSQFIVIETLARDLVGQVLHVLLHLERKPTRIAETSTLAPRSPFKRMGYETPLQLQPSHLRYSGNE